jgi:hypothetical protein
LDPLTFDLLERIRHRHKTEFGKICQILLAISFCKLGFKQVVEKSVQGVDIDINDHPIFPKLSIEVKTTAENTVIIEPKDVQGLKVKEKEGYEIAYAVLRLGVLSDWIIAKGKGIPAGKIAIGRLQRREISDLQNKIREVFPEVVAKYQNEILQKSNKNVLNYLQTCLSKEKEKAAQNK